MSQPQPYWLVKQKQFWVAKEICRASLFLNKSFLLRINEGVEIVGSFFSCPDAFITEIFFFVW